jgi:hypothetical protein
MSAVVAYAPRSLRWILAVYPAHWREKYGDDALATLSDLVDDSGRLPIAEVATLLAHGTWLRMRTSVGFWATLTLLCLMVWSVANNVSSLVAPRYWTSVLSLAMATLSFGLPLAAGLAAYYSVRVEGTVRGRLLDAARAGLPVVGWVVAMYVATVAVVLAVSGWPASTLVDARILIAVLALAVTAVALGTVCAQVLRRRYAVPIAVVAMFLWVLTPWGNDVLAWRSITGSALLTMPTGLISVVPLPQTILSVSVIAGGTVLLAWAVVAVRPGPWRFVPIGTATLIAVALAVAGTPYLAAQALPESGPLWSADRNAAELVCEGSAPSVCLWPEQEAMSGALVRQTVDGAVARSAALGIPVPAAIGVTTGAVDISWEGYATADRILTNYATALVGGYIVATPEGQDDRSLALSYALAVSLGADPRAALPGISVVPRGGGEKYLDVAESQDWLGVHTVAEARQLVEAWVTNGVPGVRKP